MTTSFSHLVRGNLSQALAANPGGVLLALVCAIQVPWCWWSAARGRLAWVTDPGQSLIWLLVAVAGVCLVNWIIQLVPG